MAFEFGGTFSSEAMEAFHAGKLEKHHYHHHHHYGVKKSPHGAAFNSWNDYLGLATLIQRPEKGFRSGAVEQVEEEEEEEEEEEGEELEEDLEEEEEEEGGEAYFSAALDLRHLCSRLEQRFAGLSPFSGAPGVFHCGDPLEARERFLHAPPAAAAAAAAAPPPPPMLLPSSRGGPSARLLKPSSLQVCVFCRNNKEAVALYTTHILKGPDGRVLCPVLRRYTCPLCGASGDNAHTIKYCPLSKMHGKVPPPPLKSARHLLGKRIR